MLESEWEQFSDEIVEAANVPTPSWAWFLHKKDVIKRLKRELQYESDIKRVLRTWNKHFKRKGFQVWLELPVAKGEPIRSQSADQGNSSDEDVVQTKKDEKRNAKKFRVIVSSSVEKGSSVYSRTSSLTRSVSREGLTGNQQQHRAAQKAHEKATEHAAEQEGKGRSSAEDKEAGQVVMIDTVDSTDKENTLNKEDSSDKLETPDSKEFKNFDSMDGSNEKGEQIVLKTESSVEGILESKPKATNGESSDEAKPALEDNAETPVEAKADPEKILPSGNEESTTIDKVKSPIEAPVAAEHEGQKGEASATKT